MQDLGEFESEPSQPVVASEPVAPVYTMPKIEPEIIKQWREEFKLRTDKIEADADQEVTMKLLFLIFNILFRLMNGDKLPKKH